MADVPPAPAWRSDSALSPGRGRRAALLAVLLGLVGLAGVTLGVLYWLAPPRELALLPAWITAEPDGGTIPWAEQDRAALLNGGWLGRPLDDTAANPNRDQLRLRFLGLSRVRPSQPVVVYLAAPASVDAAGGVYLLPADPLGDHPRNRLPLAELLAHVRDCPARHKLLVLHLTPPREDPLSAPPAGLLSRAVFRVLEENPDPDRLCLVACGPGQVPFASADLGRTAFGYYLEAGLRGAADGWGGERDGRVTVTELAAFVRGRVERWSAGNRAAAQTPVLVGSAPDFTVQTYPRSEPPEPGPDLAPADAAYPAWLREAWERRDRWLAGGTASASPRAFVRLRGAILTAERDLLAGRPVEAVQQDLARRLAELDRSAADLAAVPAPDPLPTLAALFPGYILPDPAVFEELKAAVLKADARPPAAPPPAEKPATPTPPAPLPPDFDPLKAKPHPVLAVAAFRLLAEDPAPSANRVRWLAQLLAGQEPTPLFAETLLVRRLADLADVLGPGDWSPGRAALALQAARAFEDAAARPAVLVWAGPALDEAYRLRADAEAALFAPGFVSAAETQARLDLAAAAARQVKAAADQLASALAARDAAVFWLTGATPAVDAGLVPLPAALWLADATRELADAITPPAKSLDAAALGPVLLDWQRKEAAARQALAEAAAPFRADFLARLRGRAEAGDAGPAVLAELDAVLATPLVPAGERASLWSARATLARRLCEAVVRKDRTDDEAFRKGLANPPAPDPREPVPTSPTDRDPSRRAQWSAALLRVGGLPAERVSAIEGELTRLEGDPFAFAGRLRRLWLEEVPPQASQARLAIVVPDIPAAAVLDQPARNPVTAARRESARRLWAWHAARFAHETRDPLDPASPAPGLTFTTAAARACAAAAGSPPEPYLELAADRTVTLTPDRRRADLPLNLRLLGVTDPRTVRVRVFSPSDEWVRVPVPVRKAGLSPVRQERVGIAVEAGGRPVAHPGLRGVLAEAELGGRTFHRRVPVSLDALVNELHLLVRTDPKAAPVPAGDIRVRPNNAPRRFELLLANPSPKPRTVVARLAGLNRQTAPVTLAPGKVAPLVFPPAPGPSGGLTLPGSPSQASASPGTPPVNPADVGFEPLRGPLAVELIDPASPDEVLQTFTLPVGVADPREYLRVTEAVYQPAGSGRPNRLRVVVVPEQPLGDPPCVVTLSLPADRNPEVIIKDGNLSGSIPADGSPLVLYAENVTFPTAGEVRLTAALSADGVERAFTFAGTLASTADTVRLTPVTAPTVRVKPEPYATGLAPLPVRVEVDNPPEGATLAVRVGNGAGADAMLTVEPAKPRLTEIKFEPKGDALLLRGSLRDPVPVLPVGQLVGVRFVEADLLDRSGAVAATDRAAVTFDGTPPRDVRFIDLPPRAAKGQPLPVRATCDLPVSGIKEVRFFLGRPANDAPPANAATVPGQLFDPKTNEWRASVPLPKEADRVTLGVQFVSRAGLSKAAEPADVELADAAELNKPKPGSIVGTLIENKIPQPGLAVSLLDEKGQPAKPPAKTKADGTFEFKDLPPGKYYLVAENEITNREVREWVEVVPGETMKKAFEMLLK